MFLREQKIVRKDKIVVYLHLYESKRVDGHMTCKHIKSFGNKEKLIADGKYDEIVRRYGKSKASDDSSSEILWSYPCGPALVYDAVWRRLRFFEILDGLVKERRNQFDFSEAVFCMVLNRICSPCSKYSIPSWIRHGIYRPGFRSLSLQHLYRSLDLLLESRDELEEALFVETSRLTRDPLELVLFDTTSTYFEGTHTADMAKSGHSKDSRPDLRQILVGVVMTSQGIPVTHYVFDGNLGDPDAFRTALVDFTSRFKVGRVVVAADRGMVGQKTISLLEKLELPYILGARMRRNHESERALDDPGEYLEVRKGLKVKDIQVDGTRYVLCLNEEQVARDAAVRNNVVEHLQKELKKRKGKGLVKLPAKRFLTSAGTLELTVDLDKVEADARYDGKYLLRTDTDLSAADVAVAYKRLWKVERGFRDLKSELDLRPVFHRTEDRICAHVFLCFLALLSECVLDHLYRKAWPDSESESWREAKDAAFALSAVCERRGGKEVIQVLNRNDDAERIFHALGVPLPKSLDLPATKNL